MSITVVPDRGVGGDNKKRKLRELDFFFFSESTKRVNLQSVQLKTICTFKE